MCDYGFTWYVCDIYATADDALNENGKAMYIKDLSENDLDPEMVREYEAAHSKSTRHSRNKKEDIDRAHPFLSGQAFENSRGNTKGYIFTCTPGGTCKFYCIRGCTLAGT